MLDTRPLIEGIIQLKSTNDCLHTKLNRCPNSLNHNFGHLTTQSIIIIIDSHQKLKLNYGGYIFDGMMKEQGTYIVILTKGINCASFDTNSAIFL